MAFVITEFIIVCIVNVVLFIIIGGAFISNYNGLIRHAEQLKEAWGQIEAHLRRRYDALLAMSRIVRNYTKQEQVINVAVAKAHSMMGAASLADRVTGSTQMEGKVAGYMGHIHNLVSQFPDLKSNGHFQELMRVVEETGNVITQRRETYNKGVTFYNAYLMKYPTKFYAMALGFEEAKHFSSGLSGEVPLGTPDLPDIPIDLDAATQGAAIGSPEFPPAGKHPAIPGSGKKRLPEGKVDQTEVNDKEDVSTTDKDGTEKESG